MTVVQTALGYQAGHLKKKIIKKIQSYSVNRNIHRDP